MNIMDPGDWRMDTRNHEIVVRSGDGFVVCKLYCADPANPDWLGDMQRKAQLIAAAPRLLAAARAGAKYSNALKKMQHDIGCGKIVEDQTGELDRLFEDWHDKTHAALDRLQ